MSRVRAGIVGGGQGSFIGAVHRMAIELDGEALVIAGAMSSDPARARASAAAWHLDRSYDSFRDMARGESARADGIQLAIIAAPNHLHLPMIEAFLGAGIHVVCDKPLALNLQEGERIARLVEDSGRIFALTHNYTGYPMVRQARELIRSGRLGQLRKVLVEYHQDWLMSPLELQGNRQAEWRTDPARAGGSGCVGDIGTHAENLLEYVTGTTIESLCADLSTFVPGRSVDDDASMLFRLANGAKGALLCSQVACGEENNLTLRVYGADAALEWSQQEPNSLKFMPASEPARLYRAGQSGLAPAARAASRLPAGHPEGYVEAFASLYRDVLADVRRFEAGQALHGDYPGVVDGLRGLRFVAAAVESSRGGNGWVAI